jgi:hypothetical protein
MLRKSKEEKISPLVFSKEGEEGKKKTEVFLRVAPPTWGGGEEGGGRGPKTHTILCPAAARAKQMREGNHAISFSV